MNLALKRGINNWEHSGQGDGGYISSDNSSNNDDEDNYDNGAEEDWENNSAMFGKLHGHPQHALD